MGEELETLQGLGLSSNEAKLYLLLAREGSKKASELSSKSGLQRRSVYDTLAALEKKGLVGKAHIAGVLTFSPSPPSSLLSFVDEKRDAAERIMPALAKRFESEETAGASVLYGPSGIKMVLEDILQLRADYCVYYGQMQIFDTLPKFIRIFHEKKKRLGIKSRYILLDIPIARERSKKIPLAEVKFTDPSALSAGVWWTYADRLVLFVWHKDPITIYIKNAELARTFRKNFEGMFESKTRIYRGDEGMKALLESTLEHKEVLFIGGSGQGPLRYRDYFEKRYNPEAKKRGITWLNVAQRAVLKTPATKQPFHRIRLLPKHFGSNPNVIWIFGDTVANVVWLSEPVAFIVQDADIARAYRNYFQLLWKMAERR